MTITDLVLVYDRSWGHSIDLQLALSSLTLLVTRMPAVADPIADKFVLMMAFKPQA